MRVRVSMATFDAQESLLNDEERDDTSQNPEANFGLSRVVMTFAVRVSVRMTVVVISMVIVGIESVGDQVQESVAQQAARSKGQEDFEERLTLVAVVGERDDEQDQEGSDADEQSGQDSDAEFIS